MNRLVVATFVGILGSFAFGCSPSSVGDPCVPEGEFVKSSGAANVNDLTIDVNSTQCETRVCLSHYFQGRVTCPYGNAGTGQTGFCVQVGDNRGWYTLSADPNATTGDPNDPLCCPVLGDVDRAPITLPVNAQCSLRPAKESVYCSCRCNVPDDPDIDKSAINLCKCPSGFACVPLRDANNGNGSFTGKETWGSYCVRDDQANFDPSQATAACGDPLPAPNAQ